MYCRFIFLACFCLLLNLAAVAQHTAPDIKKGDVCMKNGDYEKAAAFYKKAADGNINDVVAKEKLGKALLALGDYPSAEAIYKLLAESPMASDTNKFYYAQVLRMNGKYDQAGRAYQSYFDLHPNDPLAADFKNFAFNIDPLLTDPKRYKLTDIPENSTGSDQGPVFCVYNFCFTSNGHTKGTRKGTYDLYMLQGGNPTNPASPQKLKGKVNGRLDEGPATFSHSGREMIFTSSNYHNKSNDGSTKLGLYHADYDTVYKEWVNIVPLNITDYNYNFMQPSLSKDGSMLFFTSDIKGGLGETDIYVSYKFGNAWGPPVNLGAGINTTGKEQTPFIADDGTLFFASDSRFGLGGFDIYQATLTDSVWGHAQNPGVPLNSAYNDFGYVSDPIGHTGYIVSDRPGGMGGNDIYHFSSTTSSFCGTLIDAKTGKGVDDGTITLLNSDGTQHDIKSRTDGEFCFELAPGQDKQVEVNKLGYARYNGTVSADSGRPVIALQPIGSIELAVSISQRGASKLQDAAVTLFNPSTGQTAEQKSDTDGNVNFKLEPNQEYVLRVTKTNVAQASYERFVRPISTLGLKSGQSLKEDAQLIYHDGVGSVTAANSTIANGTTLNATAESRKIVRNPVTIQKPEDVALTGLPNVYFESGSYDLNVAATRQLDKILALMKARPDMQVEISSNTDATGNVRANMVLSARRALACLNYFMSYGISKDRFIAVGYGDRKPVNSCANPSHCTEAEKAKNRRTEFKIIKQ